MPEERIFFDGEVDHTDQAIAYLGSYHRTSYGGCKPGPGDMVIGASSLVAKANGVAHASHVQEKLTEMVQLNEVLYACGLAASMKGFRLPAGVWCSDLLLANLCKLNVTRSPYLLARLATDLAGGIMVTMPSAADFDHGEIGPLVRKYLTAAPALSVEQRRRLMRFLENVALGCGGVCLLAESVHGACSPQAQVMQIRADAPFEEMERCVRTLLASAPVGN
ncbi:MAG: hypothetical protein HY744_03605 [Deltaproteobacteria bacterium]|nr:hypothetical protein [Deltaproteobacteria bacterium]